MFNEPKPGDLFEGVTYPTPEIQPDATNKKKKEDSGVVIYDFTYRTDLMDYLNVDGSLMLESALGVTEQQLLSTARRHLKEMYGTADITLGSPKFSTADFFYRVNIRYNVNLEE